MNLIDAQIYFQQKIEDVNKTFAEQEKPETNTIVNYLNKAVNKFLEEKYLILPSYEHRLVQIENNLDELSGLIKSQYSFTDSRTLANNNWENRGYRYLLPEDVLMPFALSCTVNRTEIYPMSNQKVFAQFVSRKQAEKLISNTSDKVMLPKPLAFIEDNAYVIVIGDAYTTSVTAGPLSYVRKPFKLGYEYTELYENALGFLNISAIPNNTYFIVLNQCTYYNASIELTNYYPGDKVLKLTGYPTIWHIGSTRAKVGYPYGYTDTFDFPLHLHNMFVDMAVALFLDEAKFKLIPKSSS